MKGQAKIDFEKWYNETIGKQINVGHLSLYTLNQSMINSVIIDFFDSIGICILPTRVSNYWCCIIEDENRLHLDNYLYFPKCKTRQEATEKAIEKAVEIYNNLKFRTNE